MRLKLPGRTRITRYQVRDAKGIIWDVIREVREPCTCTGPVVHESQHNVNCPQSPFYTQLCESKQRLQRAN